MTKAAAKVRGGEAEQLLLVRDKRQRNNSSTQHLHQQGDDVDATGTSSTDAYEERDVTIAAVSDTIDPSALESGESRRSTTPHAAEQEEREGMEDAPPSSSSKSCCGRLGLRIKKSLAFAPTTPLLFTILIPLLALANHAIFAYGQIAPMWRLVLSSDIDVWYNATSLKARSTFYSIGLADDQHLQYQEDRDVRTFTYSFAINELWKADGMPGKLLPRTAAVLLVIFSGVWPHLKLLLLSLTWILSVNQTRRKRVLHWLSALGKWSLADVLVVCIMVGVLNLNWTVEPEAIKNGFVDQFPLLLTLAEHQYTPTQICTQLLKLDCAKPPTTWSSWKCGTCEDFILAIEDHPETAQATVRGIMDGVQSSGGGYATLSVQGLPGIYAFCAAVVLSIALSLVVDVFEAFAKRSADREASNLDESVPLVIGASGMEVGARETMEELRTPLLPTRRQPERAEETEQQGPGCMCLKQCCFLLLAVCASVTVFAAIILDSLDRKVGGAIPQLLHDVLGMQWNRSFSLKTLALETGAAGGWDNMLMGTFALFLVVGPALRGVLSILSLLLPGWPLRPGPWLWFLTSIDFLGAFCAWEVIVLAAYLVCLLMPSITDTILNRPECAIVSKDGSCLNVEFDPQDSFFLVMLGGVLLVVVAQFPWIVSKWRR